MLQTVQCVSRFSRNRMNSFIRPFVHSLILRFIKIYIFGLWAAKQRDFQADMQAKHIIYAKIPE